MRRDPGKESASGIFLAIIVAVTISCGGPTEPHWPPVEPDATIGEVRFTVSSQVASEGQLEVYLSAANLSGDTTTVELLGGDCLIIARVFSDQKHRNLIWQSKAPNDECITIPFPIFLLPGQTQVISRAYEFRVTRPRYVTGQIHSFSAYHLDAGMVDPRER